MLTGYNTDIKHEGVIYHVQTEDGGTENPVIVSLIYQGGRILASKKTSYAQLLGTDGLLSRLRDLLEKQHRDMIKVILTGSLGAIQQKAPEPKAAPAPPSAPAAGERQPAAGNPSPRSEKPLEAPSGSATEKNLDQVILEYLASEIDKD
ncbi:MAG: hypothetical protein JSV00_10230 [bacterium]|nr:MAG: hypothetical protein JSV00_10230 [bacterium]